ncbi:MAG TPA: hypothetical protein PLI93_08790 [Gemmatimonadales bacterium]|nr:hypothetical protein [Gemmatimonadota bacterium]MCB9518275.1 hypothetical protein [Gemmatimonadales bacterium]HPF62139.1 hypothetical protein [Gemmatimonadales bacterium]HRX18148.1 hypothetical protein [Gemmatimonadales bacterium]
MERSEIRIVLRVSAVGSRIGDPPTSELVQFRGIPDAMLLDDGRIVVGDKFTRRVLLIGTDDAVSVLATHGAGPGEVMHPSALLKTGPSQVTVLDNALFRVQTFDLAGGTAMVVRTETTSGQPRVACKLGGGYAGLHYDPRSQTMLQFYQPERGVVGSVGPAPSRDRRYNSMAAQGAIMCSDTREEVVWAQQTGEISAASAAGGVSWRRLVPGYEPALFEVKGDLVTTGPIPDGAVSSRFPVAVVRVNEDLGLVQLARFRRPGGDVSAEPELEGYSTVLFDLASGAVVGEQQGLPRILDVAGNQLLVGGMDPQPWLARGQYVLVDR